MRFNSSLNLVKGYMTSDIPHINSKCLVSPLKLSPAQKTPEERTRRFASEYNQRVERSDTL